MTAAAPAEEEERRTIAEAVDLQRGEVRRNLV